MEHKNYVLIKKQTAIDLISEGWITKEDLGLDDEENKDKIMICGMFQKGLCHATICNRQKPHKYDFHECNLLCENMQESKCLEYTGQQK